MRRLLLFIILGFSFPMLTAKSDEALARKYFLENDLKNAYKEYKKLESKSIEAFTAINEISEYQAILNNNLSELEEIYEQLDDPSPFLYFLVNSHIFRADHRYPLEDKIEFFEGCLENKNLHPQLVALIKESLSDFYLRVNDFDKSLKIKQDLGTVDHWSLIRLLKTFQDQVLISNMVH